MFNLGQSIAEWRRQMLAAGIKTPVPLEELESHLREDIEGHVGSGLSEQSAFDLATQQIGQAGILETEFTKVGPTVYEKLKQALCTLAGVPNHQLATNMNTTNQNSEPRWATYLKALAFVFPALFLWAGAALFVLPKLKEVCAISNTTIPKPMLTIFALTNLFWENFIFGTLIIVTTLAMLEWRSRRWPRYRRLFFGMVAYVLNFSVLILISAVSVMAVSAATNLMHK